jgi:ribosomal protein S18 acetylase RimI-like enzyme
MQADQVNDHVSLEDIKSWFAPTPRFDPYQDILFAMLRDSDGEERPVGFSRTRWYTGLAGARLYVQSSFLLPQGRALGFWPAIVARNDERLRQIAATQPGIAERYYQGWATSKQAEWIAALNSQGYREVRHFNNMLHSLQDIREHPLPAGFEVRPVRPEHMRPIWEAQRQVQAELFEYFAEMWADERYEAWASDPSHTPHLWQVAWEGDQVAGMILNRIDAAENQALNCQRGYTEHIFIGKPWRKRGLAKALLSHSLHLLKAQGMREVELGVDAENASGAYAFYKDMGYQTYSVDIWLRKPMP